MKTIEQLIEDLGQWVDICGNWHELHIVRYYNYVEVKDEKGKLYITFYINGESQIHVAIMEMPFVYVRNIVEYASSTSEVDWFTQEKAKVESK